MTDSSEVSAVDSVAEPAMTSDDATDVSVTDGTEEVLPEDSILDWQRLTGDWGSVRTSLDDVGIQFKVDSVNAYLQNFRGGVNTHDACDFTGDLRYIIEVDFDKMGVLPGASFYMRARSTYNDGIRAETGAFGRSSDTTGKGDNSIYVDRWWYRQDLFGEKIEIRLGRLETKSSLFDTNAYAGRGSMEFMNSALVKNPTVPHLRALGAYFKWRPCEWFQFRMGAVDPFMKNTRTGFDTAFHSPARFNGYWEFQITPKISSAHGKLPGHYRAGLWYTGYPKKIQMDYLDNSLAPRYKTNDVGFYASFDQMVYKENDDPEDKQGLGLFLRYGYADGYINLIENFWSVGASYTGLVPTRDKDTLAFGVAQSLISRQYREQVEDRYSAETVYELYYRCSVTPWLDITPDIQWIHHPSGKYDVENALVGGVRFYFRF